MNIPRAVRSFAALLVLAAGSAAAQQKTVLIPLPAYGFDPTETAVPWKKLRQAGFKVVFATPKGSPGEADAIMVTGERLPPAFKRTLMARADAVALYHQMRRSAEFNRPISYEQIDASKYDALMLTGGHEKGMRVYLESREVQRAVVAFFEANKPVGAICHGTLPAARARSPKTGQSVLYGRKTTGLTKAQEMSAYAMTALALGDYYRTYDMALEDEVKAALASPADFLRGPGPVPVKRDSAEDLSGFVVRDRNYVSARWPGDAYTFAAALVALIREQ
ncbi:MAG: DJ-1/PfpI family protein [Elusimicrobia bacterium]|nr:DJ-1/PfpI family protein [Elusimicrobiota bacterium]